MLDLCLQLEELTPSVEHERKYAVLLSRLEVMSRSASASKSVNKRQKTGNEKEAQKGVMVSRSQMLVEMTLLAMRYRLVHRCHAFQQQQRLHHGCNHPFRRTQQQAL